MSPLCYNASTGSDPSSPALDVVRIFHSPAGLTKEGQADGHHALHLAQQLHRVCDGCPVHDDCRAGDCQACGENQWDTGSQFAKQFDACHVGVLVTSHVMCFGLGCCLLHLAAPMAASLQRAGHELACMQAGPPCGFACFQQPLTKESKQGHEQRQADRLAQNLWPHGRAGGAVNVLNDGSSHAITCESCSVHFTGRWAGQVDGIGVSLENVLLNCINSQ